MGILVDLSRAFFPFVWSIFCFIGFIGYIAMPDSPKYNAAGAWLISMVLSIALLIHLWRFHRTSSGMAVFAKMTQQSVNGKLMVVTLVAVSMYIAAIVYWIKDDTVSDAIGYTGSWIICMILIGDLYIYHRG
eukprot:772989_1